MPKLRAQNYFAPLMLVFLLTELSNTLKIAGDAEYSRPVIFTRSRNS